jgi:hypothetical protein
MGLKEGGCKFESSDLEYSPVTDSLEQDSVQSGFIKGREYS